MKKYKLINMLKCVFFICMISSQNVSDAAKDRIQRGEIIKGSLDYLVLYELSGNGKNDRVIFEAATNKDLLKSRIENNSIVGDTKLPQVGYMMVARRKDGSINAKVLLDLDESFTIPLAGNKAFFTGRSLINYMLSERYKINLIKGYFQLGQIKLKI